MAPCHTSRDCLALMLGHYKVRISFGGSPISNELACWSDAVMGKVSTGLSPFVVLTIISVIVLLSIGQVLFKYAAQYLDFSRPTSFISAPLAAALALYGVATLCWLLVLTKVPLNIAFSFYGLVFLFVPALSWLILKEQPGSATIVGSIIIAIGVIVVAVGSRT